MEWSLTVSMCLYTRAIGYCEGSFELPVSRGYFFPRDKIDPRLIEIDFEIKTVFANVLCLCPLRGYLNCSEGSNLTPAHHYPDFRFKTYAPLAFRYFRELFGIKPDDYLVRAYHFPFCGMHDVILKSSGDKCLSLRNLGNRADVPSFIMLTYLASKIQFDATAHNRYL